MNFVVATHVNKHVIVYQHDSLESALDRCSNYNQDNGYADLYTDDPNFTHEPLESGPIWYVEHLALVSPRSIIEGTTGQKLLVNDWNSTRHIECLQDMQDSHDEEQDEAYMEWIQSRNAEAEALEYHNMMVYESEMHDVDDGSLCNDDERDGTVIMASERHEQHMHEEYLEARRLEAVAMLKNELEFLRVLQESYIDEMGENSGDIKEDQDVIRLALKYFENKK